MGFCIAETKYGAVKGERIDGAGADVCVWRGIPYAAPPVGALRFREPLPPERWNGVRDALEFGPACPQGVRVKGRAEVRNMSEDCLTLNIWAPADESASAEHSKKTRPVFFYIHGGSFIEGSGGDEEYDSTELVKNGDIIVVTLNYRLGALGFMDFSFLDESFKPNTGLMDIVMALRWVHENIGAFGGDKNNVTICGQSAGATCAGVLPMIGEARQYFNRAIMMSAVPELIHSQGQAAEIAKCFLEFNDIGGAEALKNADALALASRQDEFAQKSGLGVDAFSISIDGELVKSYMIPAAKEGMMEGVPMLIGTTREEMSFALFKQLSYIADIENIKKISSESESEEVKKRIADAYGRYGKRGEAIMYTDFCFRLPGLWFAEAQSGHADTWMYRFDFETFGMRISRLHAFHSCDVPFLFGNFKAGLAKLMVLVSPVKTNIRKVHAEFQGDFLAFIRTGELPWEKCGAGNTPAKCYNLPSTIEPVIPYDVKQAYAGSEFERRVSAGEVIEIMVRKNEKAVDCG